MKRGIIGLLFLAILVGSVSAEYYPYDYPQYTQPTSYGYSSFANFDFDALYDQYHLFIDAIIFGFIFFGVGSLVFGGKAGFTPLYIGLGLFMTGSLLLFEARNTVRLLDIAGPWAVTVFVLILVMLIYRIVHDYLIQNVLVAAGAAIISAIWLIGQLSSYLGGIASLTQFLNNPLVIIGAVVAIVVGLIKNFGLKATKP